MLIEGVGGMGSRVRWSGMVWSEWEVANPPFGTSLSSHNAHTVANNMLLVGHRAIGNKPRSPLSNWRTPWVTLLKL